MHIIGYLNVGPSNVPKTISYFYATTFSRIVYERFVKIEVRKYWEIIQFFNFEVHMATGPY